MKRLMLYDSGSKVAAEASVALVLVVNVCTLMVTNFPIQILRKKYSD